jgi:hypothetical protein
MKEQKSASGYKMDEQKKQQMRVFLDLVGDRIEVLECLETNAYFFPDWTAKITEGIQSVIDYKQEKNISCDDEKEALANIGYFFTKMAYFSGLISDWRNEMANGKKVTEEALDKM